MLCRLGLSFICFQQRTLGDWEGGGALEKTALPLLCVELNAIHEFLAPVSMHLGVIAVCLRKAANAKFLLVLSCEHVGAHHLLEELIDLRMHSFTHVRVHHVGRMHCPCALDMASSVNRKLLELKRVLSVNRKLLELNRVSTGSCLSFKCQVSHITVFLFVLRPQQPPPDRRPR